MGSVRNAQGQLHVPDLPLLRIAGEAPVKGHDIRSGPKPGDVSVGFFEGGVSVPDKADAGATPNPGEGNKKTVKLQSLVMVGLVVEIQNDFVDGPALGLVHGHREAVLEGKRVLNVYFGVGLDGGLIVEINFLAFCSLWIPPKE